MGTFLTLQTWGMLLGYGMEFGLDRAGLRAWPHENHGKLIGRILLAQLCIAFTLLPIIIFVAPELPIVSDHPSYPWLVWAYALVFSVTPFWTFLAQEKLFPLAILETLGRILAALWLWQTIQTPDDAGLAMAVLCAMFAVITCLLWLLALYRHGFAWPTITEIFCTLREGWALFIGKGLGVFLLSSNLVILGWFLPAATVGLYGTSEKIIRALSSLAGAMAEALYPRMMRESANIQSLRQHAMATFLVALLMAIPTFALAHYIIPILFGDDFTSAATITQAMVGIIILHGLLGITGLHGLINLGLEKTLALSLSLAMLVLLLVTSMLAETFGAMAGVWSLYAALTTALCIQLLALRRHSRDFSNNTQS